MKIGASLFVVAAASIAALSGCSNPGGLTTSDRQLMSSGAPAETEMAALCDMHRRMAGMNAEAQEAMLESHMQSAHGSVNPQALAMHKQSMQQYCSGRPPGLR